MKERKRKVKELHDFYQKVKQDPKGIRKILERFERIENNQMNDSFKLDSIIDHLREMNSPKPLIPNRVRMFIRDAVVAIFATGGIALMVKYLFFV